MAYLNPYTNSNAYRFGGYPTAPNYSYIQPQMMQQPIMQQGQQPMAQQQPIPVQAQTYEIPIQEVRFVNADEANAFIVMPNSKVMLIDKKSGVAYIKSADALGQSTKELYKFEKIESLDDVSTKEEAFVRKDDLAGFAQKDDIKELVDRIERLQKQIKINDIITEGDKKSGK